MEWVDHIYIVEISGGRLVGQVYRMLERQVPDGKGLKLGIARLSAPLVLMVELRETHRHLSAARPGGGHHHQGSRGLYIVVLAAAVVTDNEGDIVGISLNGVVEVDPQPQILQPLLEDVGGTLSGILGHHNAAHIEPLGAKRVDQAEHVHIVSNPKVSPHLIFLNVRSADDHHNLRLLPQLAEHSYLTVRLKAGQHSRGVEVVKELSPELQVELVAELSYPLHNVMRLHLQILVVVKSNLVHIPHPLSQHHKNQFSIAYFASRSKSARGKIPLDASVLQV